MSVTQALQEFADLGLSANLIAALRDVGYEAPTAIQVKAIPPLLDGKDVIGQAQTGTGKTAAFALPLLARIDLDTPRVQALVLTPTRELSIQVAEAIHTYAKHLGRVRVLPIYGGQSIQPQLKRLAGGVNVVVGTPGRVMDHLRRGSLDLTAVRLVVLDEADEMLRMGFIEDVEWILEQAPATRQTALFSATMPREVRRIADRYLRDAVTLDIERPTRTVSTVVQRYLNVSDRQKLEAITRLLETETIEAALVFARTKTGAADLAERLQARGHAAESLHGDMTQAQRESVVRRLRGGQLDLVVATDVAARGLDVERISHVVNYDLPYDPGSYVHRVGRTARAGRAGTAILFVTPREQRLLREIERYTGRRVDAMRMPTAADVAARRVELFKEQVRTTVREGGLDAELTIVEALAEEGLELAEVAAAAARLARGDRSFDAPATAAVDPLPAGNGEDMIRLYVDAGRRDGVRPSDIVGAIANEAGVPGPAIGGIDVYDRFTFVEIPARYQTQVLERMARTTLRNRPAAIRLASPRTGGDTAIDRPRRPGPSRRPDRRDRERPPRARARTASTRRR